MNGTFKKRASLPLITMNAEIGPFNKAQAQVEY